MKKVWNILLSLLVAILPLLAVRTAMAAAGPNLISNPSAETADPANSTLPSDWSKDKWGTNTSTLTYQTGGHTGNKSLYVKTTAYTDGDAKWITKPIAVTAGKNYTFSDYYKSSVSTELVAQYLDSAGKDTYQWFKTVAVSSTTWKQLSQTFTVPNGAVQMRMLHVLPHVGWLQIDDAYLGLSSIVTPTAPSVSISSPSNNAVISGTTAVNATALDAVAMAGVQFKLDGINNLGAEDTTAPYSISWDTKTITNGSHQLTAVARNSQALSTTSTPVNVIVNNVAAVPAPTVAITAPAANTTISDTVNVIANATNAVGVQFKLDGNNLGAEALTTPYTVNWDTKTISNNGNHTLSAVARNTAGQTTTATNVIVNVNNAVAPPTDTSNLVPNPSAETVDPTNAQEPQYWSNGGWGTNTRSFAYVSSGHTGNKSVRTNVTAFTNGDAKWFFDPVTVEAGQKYDYSHFYMSSVSTDVVVQFTNASGTDSYLWLATLGASSTWKQYSASFTVPTGIVKATVLQTVYSVGWLQIDDVILAKNVPPTVTSYIANNSLETASPTNPLAPASWSTGNWGTNTPTYDYLNEGHNSNRSVKLTMTNYVDGDAKWFFDPITTLTPGAMYRFSTWYKTNTIPKAVVQFNKADGTQVYFGMPNPQPNGTSSWQYYTDTFMVPKDAKGVTVFFFLNNNGWVQIDEQTIGTYTPVSFSRPLVTLTFDDGFEENNTTVLPLLDSLGFKSTQCYATQFVTEAPENPGLVKAFYDHGHEICSHTVTHPFLTSLTTAQMDQELSQSQATLQNIIGAPVRDFASPYGDYNAVVNNEIKKYYRSHRTVDEGFNSKDNFDIYRIRVQNLMSTTTLAEYQSWLDTAKATNTWLVLVYHKVSTTDIEQFDTYSTDFNAQMQALKASGLTVKTYSAALDEVTSQL